MPWAELFLRVGFDGVVPFRQVRYVPKWDPIEIVTTRNTGFLMPRRWTGALQEASAKKLEVWSRQLPPWQPMT